MESDRCSSLLLFHLVFSPFVFLNHSAMSAMPPYLRETPNTWKEIKGPDVPSHIRGTVVHEAVKLSDCKYRQWHQFVARSQPRQKFPGSTLGEQDCTVEPCISLDDLPNWQQASLSAEQTSAGIGHDDSRIHGHYLQQLDDTLVYLMEDRAAEWLPDSTVQAILVRPTREGGRDMEERLSDHESRHYQHRRYPNAFVSIVSKSNRIRPTDHSSAHTITTFKAQVEKHIPEDEGVLLDKGLDETALWEDIDNSKLEESICRHNTFALMMRCKKYYDDDDGGRISKRWHLKIERKEEGSKPLFGDSAPITERPDRKSFTCIAHKPFSATAYQTSAPDVPLVFGTPQTKKTDDNETDDNYTNDYKELIYVLQEQDSSQEDDDVWTIVQEADDVWIVVEGESA